jgi:single-strand DNA-binding protein
MYNKVILVGNLTRDINLKYLPSGTAVADLGLATNRRWKDKQTNEDKSEVMFIDVSIFGRSAEIANQYLKKGSKVLVEGRLSLEQWTDQQGQNRSKHRIIAESYQFLDSKGDNNQNSDNGYDDQSSNAYNSSAPSSYNKPQNTNSNSSSAPSRATADIPTIDIDNEDIPF